MLCERCKIREANIKYTEIINGVKTEHNLCSQCARELDLGQYTALLDGEFPLGKLLSGLLGIEDDEEETDERARVVCPTCGTSFEDFVENSRFGCPDCYGVFDLFISDKMKQLQGSESHKGKHPKFQSRFERGRGETRIPGGPVSFQDQVEAGGAGRGSSEEQIMALDARLKEAIRQEEYELAAQYRDQIKALKERNEEHE